MGQVLSLPLVLAGVALLVYAHRAKRPQSLEVRRRG
jgi:prolipoprotein diacylglyceryltransferase